MINSQGIEDLKAGLFVPFSVRKQIAKAIKEARSLPHAQDHEAGLTDLLERITTYRDQKALW